MGLVSIAWQLGRACLRSSKGALVCGRINLRVSPAELASFFELFREPEWTPRFNIGPTQQILVIRKKPDGVRVAEPLQWGLVPSWSHDTSNSANMINARSDSVTIKPAFRNLIQRRRCLIPVTGFYEWQQINSKTKQPWHIFRSDGKPFVFAGLWDKFDTPDGDVLESCSIITTDANFFMTEIHHRMPVILSAEHWSMWLDHQELSLATLASLFAPTVTHDLQKTPVSSLVNSVRNDVPECIQPVKPVPTLF